MPLIGQIYILVMLLLSIQIILKKKTSLKKNQKHPDNPINPTIGNHPPKNKHIIKQEAIIIFEYSAKKKNTKPTAEYSTLYPDTNSDSASGKSKGTLLVSANIVIKHKTKQGKNIITL